MAFGIGPALTTFSGYPADWAAPAHPGPGPMHSAQHSSARRSNLPIHSLTSARPDCSLRQNEREYHSPGGGTFRTRVAGAVAFGQPSPMGGNRGGRWGTRTDVRGD